MKNSKFIFLALAIPALASCSGGKTSNYIYTDFEYYSETQHVKYCKNCDESDSHYQVLENHKFDGGHILVGPTHSKEGIKVYECLGCGYEKQETVPAIYEHTFNRRIIDDEYLASEATCEHQATYYYSCECGEKGTETFAVGPTLNHNLVRIEVVEDNSNKNYSAYESYNPQGLKVQYVCSTCGTHDVNLSEVIFQYQGGKSSFRYGETKLIGCYQNLSFELSGFNVSKARNEIYGVEDMKISCHSTINTSNIYSKFGEVSYSIKDKDGKALLDYEYEQLSEEKSPYTLTAYVGSGDNYLEHAVSATIEVEHNFTYSSVKRATCCSCGQKLIDGYYFNATTNQLDLSHIEGLYKDKFNPNDVTNYATGKPVNWSDAKVGVALDLVTTIDGEVIHFNGLKVDKIFTTIQEIQQNCLVTAEHSATNPLGTPYCVVACDIDCNNYVYEGGIFKWDGAIYGGSGYCFRGVFDGRGHTISNLSLGGYGIFGYLGAGAVCKDISFKDVSPVSESAPCALTYYAYMCSIDNVKMDFSSYITMQDNSVLAKCGNIVAFRMEGNASRGTNVRLENIVVDATGLDIGAITAQFTSNNSEEPSFTKYIVKCKSCKSLGMYYTEVPEGISVYLV